MRKRRDHVSGSAGAKESLCIFTRSGYFHMVLKSEGGSKVIGMSSDAKILAPFVAQEAITCNVVASEDGIFFFR